MLVAGIMKTDVATINPLATVRDALLQMKKHGVKSLVVEKRHAGDAYGLIAYRDIAKAVIADDGDIDLLNVYDIAQKPALQVSQHLEVRYLARLMIQYSVKRVLVIDNNDLQGFVSISDVVGSLIDRALREQER
jgi:CBS domain-containing protein